MMLSILGNKIDIVFLINSQQEKTISKPKLNPNTRSF